MRKIGPFKAGLFFSSFLITGLLSCAIGALFMVPTFEDVMANVWNECTEIVFT